MSFKTILVHCDASKTVSHRLAVATDLAQRFDAHLVGYQARHPFEVPMFVEGGFPMADLFKSYEAEVEAEQAAFLAAFDKATKGAHLSTERRIVEGYADSELIVQARYVDLLVLGQADADDVAATPAGLPETIALGTGRPVLVVPYTGAPKSLGKTILLCWNSSRESARAASDALPFLKSAENVILLVVDPKTSPETHGAEPGADAALWLSRHGVKVTVQRDVAPDSDVAGIILSRAADHGADLIVMGVYGHSRMREWVLGGVSRTLLGSMTVPVLMSH